MQFDVASTCIGFLIGTFTGAAGGYFANKYTDARRKKEAAKENANKFAQVAAQMPELLQEMRQDLTEHPSVREFFVLLGGAVLGGTSSPSFQYRDAIHPGLMGKLHILENHGYLTDVTPKDCPKYRMTEEFVRLLREMPSPRPSKGETAG